MDVESYGDEPASSAMNLAASQNNNNITKMDAIRSSMRPIAFTNNTTHLPSDEHMITSRNSIWQQHAKHAHRLGASPPTSIASNLSLVNSMPPLGCGPPTMFVSESGATSTSSDQITEYDRNTDSPNRMQQQHDRLNTRITDMQKASGRDLKNGADNNCDNDNDEEVIVTNDDDECPKKLPKDLKRNDKNRYNSILSIR